MKIVGFVLLALYLAAAAAVPTLLDPGWMSLLSEILLMLAMAQMWNLLAGYTGLVSLGHQAFIGVGAYFVFYFSDRLDLHPFLLLPVAGLVCALVAAALAPLLFACATPTSRSASGSSPRSSTCWRRRRASSARPTAWR